MNTSKKIIFTTAIIGVLGISGVARAVSANELHRADMLPSHRSTQIAQVGDSEVQDTPEATDPVNDNDTEVNDERVPVSLSQVGEYGEAVYDMAKINAWTKSTANLTSLQDAAKQLRNESKGVNKAQLNKSITALKKAVTAKNRQAVMRNANQVTLIAAKITVQYEPKVPVEVTLLDYYGRELEIWSATGDTAKLKTIAGEMRQTWNTVRPSIKARGGSTQVQKFNNLVARVEAAKSPQEYSRLAIPILDEVDNLEKAFK